MIFLLGMRGVGKSTLGIELAKKGRVQFLDLDLELERLFGSTILEFIAAQGIDNFRQQEFQTMKKLVEDFSQKPGGLPLLLAPGGGVVDYDSSLRYLEEQKSPKILLDSPASDIWERLKNSPERKKIGNLETFSDLEQLYNARRPKYQKIATYTVPSQGIQKTLHELEEIISKGK